jgi:RecA-family ATPase
MLSVIAKEAPEPPPPSPHLFADYLDPAALLAAPPPALDFVMPGLLAGTLGVLVSPGGVGKSMLALTMALSIAAGRDAWQLLGEDPAPGPVLVVSAEDPAEILARRLHALRDSAPGLFTVPMLERLHLKAAHGTGFAFGTWDGKSFMMSSALETLGQEIEALRPRLVILDTLNRCLAGISENDNGAMGRVISELEAVIAPTRAACLMLHHIGKATALSGQGDHQQAARGASAITDNARLQLNLVGMSKEEAEARGLNDEQRRGWVRLVAAKVNYAPPMPDRWLKRETGGVLSGDETPPPERPKPSRRKGGRDHDDD